MAIDPDKVRNFIRDRAELNVLLNNEEEFSDEEIESFEEAVKDDILMFYPALKARKLPVSLVIYGILSKLFAAEAAKQNRNQMNINDDNVGAIDVSNKASQYLSFSQQYEQRFRTGCENLCAQDFYQNTWGGVSSNSFDNEYFVSWEW